MARHSPRSSLRRSSKSLRTEEEASPTRGNGSLAHSTGVRSSGSSKSLPGKDKKNLILYQTLFVLVHLASTLLLICYILIMLCLSVWPPHVTGCVPVFTAGIGYDCVSAWLPSHVARAVRSRPQTRVIISVQCYPCLSVNIFLC